MLHHAQIINKNKELQNRGFFSGKNSIFQKNDYFCKKKLTMEKYAIGIDIGGTNTDIGLVRNDGKVVSRFNLSTSAYSDVNLYINDMISRINTLMQNAGIKFIDGVGIDAPNANYYNGCIEANTANFTIKEQIPLKKLMEQGLHVPVVVSNDANAAAYGELVYGAAKGMKHFIMFTLGTGVGSGIVVDGRLVHGSTGTAGELGHSILIPDGRLCSCGRHGCIEMYASARGICQTCLELLKEEKDYTGILAQYTKETLTSKIIGEAANQGDPIAIKVFEKTGYWLGIAMANAATFSAPEAIFLMGGPTKAGDVLMKPLRESFEKHLLMIYKDKVKIMLSQLNDNDAAILGAAALLQNKD